MNLMFFIVLGIFVFYIYLGSRLGLVKMVFYLISSVALLIVSFVISPVISTQMMKNEAVVRFVDEKIEAAYEKVEKFEQNKQKEENKQKKENKEKEEKKEKKDSLKGKGNIFAKNVTKKIGKAYLTPLVIRTTVFLIVYLVAATALFILEKMFSFIAKLPVLNSLNRLGGAGIGVLRGLIAVWLLFMVLTILMDKEMAAKGLRQIGENDFLRLLYDNNMITRVIAGFIE